MTAAGWRADPAHDVTSESATVGRFRHPVTDEFTATAWFYQSVFLFTGDPQLTVAARIAIDYEPAYRLAPLLLDKPSRGERDIDGGALMDPPGELTVSISRPDEVGPAADQLTAPVLDHALAYARSHATLEDLLSFASADPKRFSQEITTVPLLLAAASRHDEARAALAGYLASGEDEVAARGYRRFARRLTMWLDDGGELPDPPTEPVGSSQPPRNSDPPTLADHRHHSQQRREAFQAVKQRAASNSDDELRAMLAAELDARGITEDQLWVETAIDAIRRTRLQDVQAAAQGIGAIAGLGTRLVALFRGKPSEKQERVDWLEPPDEACYPVKGRDWVVVELRDDNIEFLARAHTASRRVAMVALLDAWIDWDPLPRSEDSQLTVRLGSRPVGAVSTADTAHYESAMAAAALHQELPMMKARLTALNHDPRYLLEISCPRRP
jgi:hypothetical protein